jgi:hypothetical protein
MPRSHEVQSGPEDTSEAVDYGDDDLTEINAENKHDGDDDSDIDTRRRQRKQPASSSSQQLNHIKESALNARTAASSAASNSSAANNTGESNDLRLITLVKRYERKLNDISKRERDLAEREKASSSSSKRRKSSSSRRRSSDTSSSSDNGFSSDSGDSSDGDNHGHGGRSSSSKDSDGKDITLRQLAIMNKFENMRYVDISVFSRVNLNVRKEKKLVPISSSAEYSAAWASFNVELQQYLINASRSDDALMVSKYYSQLVRLLTDYSSQWKLVMELDEYVRGATFKVNAHTVWSIDHDDDYVSQYKYNIRMKHLDAASRPNTSTSSQRGTLSSTLRRGGNNDSNVTKPRRSTGICYAYNGEVRPNEWTNTNHCRGKDQCKFQHKCMICGFDHAVYENNVCAAQPRARTPVARHK